MITSLIVHDNKLFKNKTIFSFEANTSKAKYNNVVEFNVTHLKNHINY